LKLKFRAAIENEIKAVREALNSNDTNRIKSASEKLQKVLGEIGAKMYQQAGPGGTGASGSGFNGGQKSEKQSGQQDAQDASYEVINEDK